MGVRLTCSYKPAYNNPNALQLLHTLEIHDANGGGNDEVCLVRGKEPEIKMEGQSRDPFPVMQPSSCQFTIRVDNAAARSFISDFAVSEDETRFRVVVRNTAGVLFRGIILPDEVTVEERSWPDYDFTLTAICGLTYLQNVPYTDSNYEPFSPYQQDDFLQHIAYAFDKLPTKDLYDTPAIGIIKDWEDDLTGGDFDTLLLTHNVFQDQDETSRGPIPFTCWDVLKYICHAFDFRLYSPGFGFMFEQLNLRINGGGTIEYYDISMSPAGSAPLILDLIDVSCDNGSRTWLLEGDASRTFKPPIKISSTTYYFRGFAEHFEFTNEFELLAGQAAICNNNLGVVFTNDGEGRLRLTGTFEFVVLDHVPGNTNANYERLNLVFYLTIQVGDQYYNRELADDIPIFYNRGGETGYKDVEWSTTNKKYAIIADRYLTPKTVADYKYSMAFEIETLPLDAALDGEQMSICFEGHQYDINNTEVTLVYTRIWWVDRWVYLTDDDPNKVQDSYIRTNILGNQNNTKQIHFDLVFGDGPSTVSDTRIRTFDTFGTTEWTSGILGGPYPIYELSARSRLARGRRMITYLEGTMEGDVSRFYRYRYDGDIWIMLTGTHHTGLNRLTGEFANLTLGSGAGSKVAITGTSRTARSPGGTITGGGAVGRYYRRLFIGPISSATITDLDGYNPADWSDDDMAALVLVYRNGVKQRYLRTGPGGGIDGYDISWNGTSNQMTINPYEALSGSPHSNLQAEELEIFVWQFN